MAVLYSDIRREGCSSNPANSFGSATAIMLQLTYSTNDLNNFLLSPNTNLTVGTRHSKSAIVSICVSAENATATRRSRHFSNVSNCRSARFPNFAPPTKSAAKCRSTRPTNTKYSALSLTLIISLLFRAQSGCRVLRSALLLLNMNSL